jgi:LPS-assembly lipoprotein
MLKSLGFYTFLMMLFTQLAGCGFHLRGLDSTGALTFKSAQLEMGSGVKAEFEKALVRQLSSSGVTLLQDQSAEVQIQLPATQYESTRTSSSGLGDATSELLKMTQPFTAVDLLSGKTIASDSSSVYRDRQINTASVLSSDSELRSIQQAMSEELARKVIDRIRRSMQAENQQHRQANN